MNRIEERSRILLAEDDPELRELLARRLEERGLEVVSCAHGVDLVEELERSYSWDCDRPVDVVVSDVRMPGVTGLSVLEGLAALDRGCAVVLMTAFGDESLHERARRLRAAAVFDKPFDVRQLLGLVQSLAEERRRAREGIRPN